MPWAAQNNTEGTNSTRNAGLLNTPPGSGISLRCSAARSLGTTVTPPVKRRPPRTDTTPPTRMTNAPT